MRVVNSPSEEALRESSAAIKPAAGFVFFPTDKRQALRVRRYLLAVVTSALVACVLLIAEQFGILLMDTAVRAAGAMAAMVVLFFLLLRSGLNLRLKDPSMTTEQIGSALLVLAYVMYCAPQSRGTLLILYLMPLMFGVLRLTTPRMLALAALALCAHALIVWLSSRTYPAFDLRSGLIQLAVLAVVLPWFAVMGGYVNRLRRRLSDTNRTLTEAVTRIEQLAIRDVLTGAYNRRHLIDTLGRERSRSIRLGSPLSICLFDLDHFKSINDRHGHPAGDAVLTHFTSLACAGLRANDVFGRYGGEEFMLVLPDTDVKGACASAERIREQIAAAAFPAVPAGYRVTATIGVAALAGDQTLDALIDRVDAALYSGKIAGRNRVTAT